MNRPPIHPLSAVILIAVDSLWMIADWSALLWIVTIPLSFLSCFLPSFLIQKFIHKDGFGRATAIAAFLAVLAAIPTPISGTVAGTLVLGWAGLNAFGRNPHPQNPTPQPPALPNEKLRLP